MKHGSIVNAHGPDVSEMYYNRAISHSYNQAHEWGMARMWMHMTFMYLKCVTIEPFLIHKLEPINEKWLCLTHECIRPLRIWIFEMYRNRAISHSFLIHMYYVWCMFMFTHICTMFTRICTIRTGWRRLIGSPKLQIIFHKRATKYRSLLRKMSYKDKGSYESSPPCTKICQGLFIKIYIKIYMCINMYINIFVHMYICSFIRINVWLYVYTYIYINTYI